MAARCMQALLQSGGRLARTLSSRLSHAGGRRCSQATVGSWTTGLCWPSQARLLPQRRSSSVRLGRSDAGRTLAPLPSTCRCPMYSPGFTIGVTAAAGEGAMAAGAPRRATTGSSPAAEARMSADTYRESALEGRHQSLTATRCRGPLRGMSRPCIRRQLLRTRRRLPRLSAGRLSLEWRRRGRCCRCYQIKDCRLMAADQG